jgi:tetratricopeptide (TPR) repeat protein
MITLERRNFIALLSKFWKTAGLIQNIKQLQFIGDNFSLRAYYGFILSKGDDITIFKHLHQDSLKEFKKAIDFFNAEEVFLSLRGIALSIRIYLDLEDLEQAQKSLQTLAQVSKGCDLAYFSILYEIFENELRIKNGKTDEAIPALENLLSVLENTNNVEERKTLILHTVILLTQIYWNAESLIPLEETLKKWNNLGVEFHFPVYYFYWGECKRIRGLNPEAIENYTQCVEKVTTSIWKTWFIKATIQLCILDKNRCDNHLNHLREKDYIDSTSIQLAENIVKMALALDNFETQNVVTLAIESMHSNPSIEVAILCTRIFIRENRKDLGQSSAEYVLKKATKYDFPGKIGFAHLCLAMLSENNEEQLFFLSLALNLLKNFGERQDYARAIFENQYLKYSLKMETDLEASSLDIVLIGSQFEREDLIAYAMILKALESSKTKDDILEILNSATKITDKNNFIRIKDIILQEMKHL